MALSVIESSDPIRVESVILHIFGDPGIGKSTLLNTAEGVLKLDFDRAEHRALGRQRIIQVDAWEDLAGVFELPVFKDAKTIAADTAGRMVELAIMSVVKDPKSGNPASGPNQHGWTKVKAMFGSFFRELRAAKKDLVIASHAKLDKDDTGRKTAYPEVAGSAGPEIFKACDGMAYYSMQGRERVLDFNVSDLHLGKNPPGWAPFVVPVHSQAPRFLAEKVLGPLKDYLNAMSEEQTAVLKAVSELGAAVEALATSPEAFTSFLPKTEHASKAVASQVRTLLWRRALALGFDFDKSARAFVKATKPEAPKEEAKPAEEPAENPVPEVGCSHEGMLAKSSAKPKTELTCACGLSFKGGRILEPTEPGANG